MPEVESEKDNTHEFVKLLNNNLKILNKKSYEHQQAIAAERTKTIVEQNIYQPGDYVLFLPNLDHLIPSYHPSMLALMK